MDIIPDLISSQLALLIIPREDRDAMLTLAARLAGHGLLRVLDGGNSFNILRLTRPLRHQTPDLEAALERITVARAFTCYQMAALLSQAQTLPVLTLVLNLLATFLDENVELGERLRLLQACLADLHRLRRSAPVIVTVWEGTDEKMLTILEDAIDQVWRAELPPPIPEPPRLF
jgi:hypothetical protein